jgi:hypothetical protein
MLKRSLTLTILGILLTAYLAAALSVQKTEFVIKTDPYQNLSISILNPDSKESIELYQGRARKFGEYRFTYYGTISKVLVDASIINNETGETSKEKEFGPYTLGTPIVSMDFYLEDKETEGIEENNTTEKNETNSTISEIPGKKSKLIGFVTGESGQFSNVYYYVAAGALGLIVFIVIFKRKIKVNNAPSEPNPKKTKAKQTERPAKVEAIVKAPQKAEESNVNDTEKKILELQKQLDQIRSEEKLAKLQKQIKLEKESLQRMNNNLEDKNPSQNNQNNNEETKSF